MKKYLFSTILLAGLTIGMAPSVLAATVERKQETDIEIKFKDKDNGFDDKAVNNLIMGATPTEITFTDGKGDQKGKGFAIPKPGSNATYRADEYELARYIVVNDDRPTDKQSTWKVEANLSTFIDTKSKQESNLIADLLIDAEPLQEYHIGAYNEANDDYDIPNPNQLTGAQLAAVIKPYTPGETPVMASATGQVSLTAGGTSVEMMSKKTKELDPNHKNKAGFGVKKGGQGYAAEFSTPKLLVKSGASKGSTHMAELTWTMTFDDASI